MGKKGSAAAAEDTADTVLTLPSTNGSQLALFPWLRELDGNLECFDSDEAYFLTTGSWVNNAGKAVFFTVQHALLARAGFISQEKYGIFKPLPSDGFMALYASKLVEVAAGAPIPRPAALATLPLAPTRAWSIVHENRAFCSQNKNTFSAEKTTKTR